MRQVMPIAAALAGGASLNSFGVVSRSVGWGPRKLGHAAIPMAAAAAAYSARRFGGTFRGAGQKPTRRKPESSKPADAGSFLEGG
jgi:hypothetical protein